jgi:hypothetical protein
MATYTPLAGVTVEAFQWLGDPLSDYTLPGWAGSLSMHTSSDQTLYVPCWNGTFAARISEWVVRNPTGELNIVPDVTFRTMYDVDAVDVTDTRRTAEESRAVALEARAAADKQRADNAAAAQATRAAEARAARPAKKE